MGVYVHVHVHVHVHVCVYRWPVGCNIYIWHGTLHVCVHALYIVHVHVHVYMYVTYTHTFVHVHVHVCPSLMSTSLLHLMLHVHFWNC